MLFLRWKSFRKKRLVWNCPDYVILLYYWRVQGASSHSHFFLLCRTFVNSIKLPAMILSWKNLQEVFLMLFIVVVLPHWKFLRARATFPCYQHSTLASQAREGLHQLWTLPWLLSIALLLPGFSITALPRALRFWVGAFYLQAFFYLALLTHILSRFCDSDAGRNTPSRILLWPALTKLSLAAEDWRMILNYSYCRYKTIGFPIVPVCHEVKTY